jgi:hypothetical protein
VVLKRTVFCLLVYAAMMHCRLRSHPLTTDVLTAETVQSASLTLQGVYDVHGRNSLPLGVFGVRNSVPDNVLEEYFEDTSRLFVDQTGYTFDASTAGKTSDGRLRYTLDIIAKNFAVTFGASFSQTLSTFSTASHIDKVVGVSIFKLTTLYAVANEREYLQKFSGSAYL